AEPVAPRALGPVERRIGALEQGVLGARPGISRYPDTDRERAAGQALFVRERIAFYVLAYAVAHFAGVHAVCFGQDDRKFFPAIAGHSVGRPTHLAQQAGEVA